METKEFLENAVATLKKLDDFNESLVRGTALAQTMRTLRETCFLGNYMRAIANAKTLLKLDSVRDTQAIAMIARSIFELAIEIELIDRIPDSAEKIIAFGEYEHLRRARKIVAYANRNPSHSPHLDDPQLQSFIDQQGARIEAARDRLWPDKKLSLDHWTQMKLGRRAEHIGGPINGIFQTEYQSHSWYAHAGLTGVMDTNEEFYWVTNGFSYGLASDSYHLILKSIIQVFEIHAIDRKILKKLEYSKNVSILRDEQQAKEYWDYLMQ